MSPKANQSPVSTPIRVASGLLATWIFILSLAGVSPVLHSWLHADADSGCASVCGTHTENHPIPGDSEDQRSEGHYCGVIALQGAFSSAIDVTLPERSGYERIRFEQIDGRLEAHSPEHCLQARAPPIEIVV